MFRPLMPGSEPQCYQMISETKTKICRELLRLMVVIIQAQNLCFVCHNNTSSLHAFPLCNFQLPKHQNEEKFIGAAQPLICPSLCPAHAGTINQRSNESVDRKLISFKCDHPLKQIFKLHFLSDNVQTHRTAFLSLERLGLGNDWYCPQ